jgi:hypothetical protein
MGARAPGHHRAGSIRRTIRSLPDPVTRSLGSLALGLFLVSDGGGFITGQTIHVKGGAHYY